MIQFLRKIFDTSDKDVKAIEPTVQRINALEPTFQPLSDDELKAKMVEYRARAENGEKLETLLPEVFAIVREVSQRTLGMRQFDVQMVGGVVLHQGRIAEMRTGEGKTLVAVAPMALNALAGGGSHLVTVNDYLARRDAVWMGPIYHFLGLSVGIIQGQSPDSDELGGSYTYDPTYEHEDPRYLHCRPCTRREAYLCDITYGTNHEFGFDYLRDNMAYDIKQLSMRELNFAIIDEVDSILIDEARTPHIISGPSMEDTSVYKEVDKVVKTLIPEEHYTADKKNHQATLTEEGMDYIEQVMEIDNIANDPKLFHHFSASVKAYAIFEKNVDYVIRGQEVVIIDTNTGRPMFGRRYSDGLHQALEAKEGVTVQRESQTVAVITFQNLFRMYDKLAGMTGTAKTEEDEFRKIYGLDVVCVPTHRPTMREDLQDVVLKSIDVKFRCIAREILRLFTKQQPVLVGTRSIEMSEKVSERITNESLQKLMLTDYLFDKITGDKSLAKRLGDDADRLFETAIDELKMETIKETMRAAELPVDPHADEIINWFLEEHKLDPAQKEYLGEALSHGIPHNVLNAKYHEREAAIISEAGRKGGVTIATNMAGRGVDILLGGRVADESVKRARAQEEEDGGVSDEYADTFMSFRRGGKERAAPPLPLDDTERRAAAEEVRELGGLYILGTERHESRRIDNQLRGRSGRQGDPGMSRFFVSLEDHLWKIFNPKILENPLLKGWPPMEEVKNKMITGMILKTQERIENHFFEGRKHVLEYDDVLNSQREHVYGMRREILLGMDCKEQLLKAIRVLTDEAVDSGYVLDEDGTPTYDHDVSYAQLNEMFPMIDYCTLDQFVDVDPGDDLKEFAYNKAVEAYELKETAVSSEVMRQLENQVMLRAVNDAWMDHLQMNDYIREGISLRGYGQQDPLIAYKRETFDLFENTKRKIVEDSAKMVFRAEIRVQPTQPAAPAAPRPQMTRMDDMPEEVAPAPEATMASSFDDSSVDWSRVGRNDTCPCGSGKKFKACHYPELRAKGVI